MNLSNKSYFEYKKWTHENAFNFIYIKFKIGKTMVLEVKIGVTPGGKQGKL